MRNSIFLAIGLIISAVPTAQAVELKPCSGTTEQRVDCLRKNMILLNSSHEAVAADLRKAVTDLTTEVGNLTTEVGNLTTLVTTLRTEVDGLKGQIPKFSEVVIQWFDHPNSCLTYLGGGLVQVTDTCTDPNRNKFVVRTYR